MFRFPDALSAFFTPLRKAGTVPNAGACNGPGSAKRYCVSHRVRGKCLRQRVADGFDHAFLGGFVEIGVHR